MASKENNQITATAKTTHSIVFTGTTGLPRWLRDSFVVAGAELQLSGAVFQYRNRPFHPRLTSPYARLERFACLSVLNRLTVSPVIHHNRENTNRFRKVFSSFLCHRRVFSRLHPRLFRGVTPDRHAGESSQTVVLIWLAHSGYPVEVLPTRNPLDRCDTCAICR